MKVYLACTIRGDRSALPVVTAVRDVLVGLGHEVMTERFLSDTAESEDGALSERQVFDRDLAWLEACDVLIAEASGSSYGVGFEVGFILARAAQTGQRIVLLFDEARRASISRMISGAGHARCRTIGYQNAADAAAQVRQALESFDPVMRDEPAAVAPPVSAIAAATREIGFGMASEPKVGALLAALVAAKPGGRFLELGTGTGHGTAWMVSAMDGAAHLDTVDNDATVSSIAVRHLGADARVTFHHMDAAEFIARSNPDSYDLVYADAWAGKFSHLEDTLVLLRRGGVYAIDDLLRQANWPDGHARAVDALVARIEAQRGFTTVRLSWASGLLLAVRH